MDFNKDFVNILADLKFISNCKRGEVMYIQNRQIVSRSLLTTLYRKYITKGESGIDTVNFINDTLSKTYHLILKYQKCENAIKYIQHLIEHIKTVRHAICELKITYEKYTYVDASFDALLLNIDRNLEYLDVEKGTSLPSPARDTR